MQMQRNPNETASEFMLRFNDIYPQLCAFYNSNWMKKARHEKKKAKRIEYDRGFGAILRMIDRKPNDRMDQFEPIVFTFGNADWGNQGVSSSFEQYVIKKLRCLGYIVVFQNEDRTSQSCPNCKVQTELTGKKGFRVKYCPQCHRYYHRDVMAAENMTRALLAEMIGEDRPPDLKRNTFRAPAPLRPVEVQIQTPVEVHQESDVQQEERAIFHRSAQSIAVIQQGAVIEQATKGEHRYQTRSRTCKRAASSQCVDGLQPPAQRRR